jgi:hypothetical protein
MNANHNRNLYRHGAYLAAIGKVMMVHGVSAVVATQGNYEIILVDLMKANGLTKDEAADQLFVELSEAINAQI